MSAVRGLALRGIGRAAIGLLALVSLGACEGQRCEDGELFSEGACVEAPEAERVEPDAVWQPAPGVSWQWQLSGTLDLSPEVEMFDLDLFDAPDSALEILHSEGRVVICYFSAGSHEDWRDDAGDFPEAAVGDALEGWAGERWLDVMDPTVREIMETRMDLAVERGCDGVEPDNVDGFDNATGFGLNATEQLDYNRFLANAAHSRGLSVGLKNDLDQLEQLVDWFDWALNEECLSYAECERLEVFTGAGKAAFHVEYAEEVEELDALAEDVCGRFPELDTLLKTWDLGPERVACP